MELKSKASLQILKPIAEVFEAIVEPNHMTQYFISESNGRMESGAELKWKFPEFEDVFPITQIKVNSPSFISFVWDTETVVEIHLEALNDRNTVVRVREKGKSLSEENLAWALSNSAGWANFLDCLKAYLEYGINLRNGAFDFMRKN